MYFDNYVGVLFPVEEMTWVRYDGMATFSYSNKYISLLW